MYNKVGSTLQVIGFFVSLAAPIFCMIMWLVAVNDALNIDAEELSRIAYGASFWWFLYALLGFIGGLFIFGFGQLIENNEQILHLLEKQCREEEAAPNVVILHQDEKTEDNRPKKIEEPVNPKNGLEFSDEMSVGQCALCNKENQTVRRVVNWVDGEQRDAFYVCRNCMATSFKK